MANGLTIIDQQFESGNTLLTYLKENNQITFHSEAENNFRKSLLLSSASFFEKEISGLVIEFAKFSTDNDERIVTLIKQKAVSRQYHTYFDWESNNANKFFAMFGETFKGIMVNKIKENEDFSNSIKAFLEIGNERNKMVHQNFAEIVIDKTADEIYKLYKSSLVFIATIRQELIK